MRGESFEPGGCSACPTSPPAIWTIRWPAVPPVGATPGMPPTPPDEACCRRLEKEVGDAPDCSACAAVGWAGGCGENADSISWIRAMTLSMLIRLSNRQSGRMFERARPQLALRTGEC